MESKPGNRSISDLVNDLTSDSVRLVREEIALARAEAGVKASDILQGLVAILLGAVAAVVGLMYLVQTVVWGLSEIMPEDLAPWLPALIVALILLVVAALMIRSGKQQMSSTNLKPERTVKNLKRDVEAVKGGLNEQR